MRNRNRSLCAERIKTWAVSWLELCTPIGVWNDLHLHKVHAQTHTHTHAEWTTCSPIAQIQNTVGTEKDYYIKPKSTQRESTADPKRRERRAKPEAARPDKQRGGADLQRAGRSEGRISALLHDDLLDFIFCAGACTTDSAVSEYFACFSFGSSVCLLFSPLPLHLFLSRVRLS